MFQRVMKLVCTCLRKIKKFIEGLLLESCGTETSEGDYFGLWTTDEQPVLHSFHKPLDKPNEQQPCEPASRTQLQDAAESSGEENLANEEYPGIQKIGKYILRRPMAEGGNKPTADEEADFRRQFPLRCVLVIAYIVQYEEEAKSVGISSYVYSGNSLPNKPLEIQRLHASKVFKERQERRTRRRKIKARKKTILWMWIPHLIRQVSKT